MHDYRQMTTKKRILFCLKQKIKNIKHTTTSGHKISSMICACGENHCILNQTEGASWRGEPQIKGWVASVEILQNSLRNGWRISSGSTNNEFPLETPVAKLRTAGPSVIRSQLTRTLCWSRFYVREVLSHTEEIPG